MSDETRRLRIVDFVEFVTSRLDGDEKGEAQIFLDRLFQAFGQPGAIEAGAKYEDRLKRPDRRGVGFADLVWGETLLVEMKKGGEPLSKHTQQMLDYWVQLAGRRPAYCVLCNFDEFWIYDFNKDILNPLDKVSLEELPDRYTALAFLFPTNETPVFEADHEDVTRKAADLLADVYKSLISRGIEPHRAQLFTLQSLVAMFAEDIELLDKDFFIRLLDECDSPTRAYDLIGGLFNAMNTPDGVTGGRYKGVKYFNGGLFAEPAAIELEREEIENLREAASKNWSKVRPEIFGTIFEHTMQDKERHAYGAHFTSQLDILKVVKPTITDPWEQLIERTAKGEKPIENLNKLHQRLARYRVLDPACGSGNFLYIAYRELKRIEAKLLETRDDVSKAKDKSQFSLSIVSARQFFGIDINTFAVELAKVTLMIARKLAIDELHFEERALPMDNLDENFRATDALIQFADDGTTSRTKWFDADVIIGNPPFLGAKRLKPEHGADYANAVRKLYPKVPGMADYCVYWFRRAHDHLPECTPEDPVAGRAGLVGTQNIRNNKSREGGLDHITETGVVVEAVDNQPWSGEANVHVSIANWIKTAEPEHAGEDLLVPASKRLWVVTDETKGNRTKRTRGVRKDKTYELTYRETPVINASLSDKTDVSGAKRLKCVTSPQCSFQGVVPGYDFVIDLDFRKELLAADSMNATVAKQFLIGRDLLTGDGDPSRAIIDFGQMPQFQARQYEIPFAYVESHVLPDVRDKVQEASKKKSDMLDAREEHLERWWQFWNVRSDLRARLLKMSRTIACARVTKRPIFSLVDTSICLDGALQIFGFDDDYCFGVLSSSTHWQWFVAKCSKLKSDYRYTRKSVWDTFPWPQSPTAASVDAIAQAGREIRRIRDEHLPKIKGGLRALYRTLELPGKSPLKDAHRALDEAVLNAYGFDPKGDLLAQLLALNLDVAAKEKRGEPVTGPGIPESYAAGGGNPDDLVTDDCIRPDPLPTE